MKPINEIESEYLRKLICVLSIPFVAILFVAAAIKDCLSACRFTFSWGEVKRNFISGVKVIRRAWLSGWTGLKP